MANLGKFIGPAGLAVIIGASNFVSPKATLDGIVPGFNYFAVWYVLAFLAYRFDRPRDEGPHDRGTRRNVRSPQACDGRRGENRDGAVT